MHRMELKDQFGTYIIEVDRDDLTIEECFELLIEPLLLAAGYQRESINSYYEG